MKRAIFFLAICGLVLLSARCANVDPAPKTTYLLAGQLPASDLRGAGGHGHLNAPMTIPLAQQNPLTELFQDMSIFQTCLQHLGVTFIGVPDKSNPNSPTNDPNYIKALQTCAAQSNIVQAITDIQNAENHLTLAQIKTQNKQYLAWRLCMIGRGWKIPEPAPDSSGRLFTMSAGSVGEMVPPPGQSILSSGDMEDCANKVAGSGH